MEDIRKTLLGSENVKLTQEEYLFVVGLEKTRLKKELIIYSIMSLFVGVFMYFSMSGEIRRSE